MSTEEMIIQVREEITRLQQENFLLASIIERATAGIEKHCDEKCPVANSKGKDIHMYYPCAKEKCEWYRVNQILGEAKDEKNTATA